MCPPVSVRHGREGMTCLYASWLYQIQHGDQLSVCFACFKVAFLDLKDMLESEDWEDEDWDPEAAELPEAGPEQEGSPGQPGHGGAEHWGPGALASAPAGAEEVGLDPLFVPTELEPQNAVPLGLGPEDADWTQALPWRFEGLDWGGGGWHRTGTFPCGAELGQPGAGTWAAGTSGKGRGCPRSPSGSYLSVC
uniref:Testis-expressed protein 19 n=1 Tax=Sciurus vulgaris TaxID=55149 RepID=A0A8D2D4V5_SCIVU